jgi:hypothetical protein
MERGRPRKRSEAAAAAILMRAASKRNKSQERRAFEHLPQGWKATEAANMLSQSETAALQKQALQQAARFEVLRKDDVDNLSKVGCSSHMTSGQYLTMIYEQELRHLDERTEYLRRTYTSLRAGRRNLHSRICQYLRSPRTAKFSHESMLRQEEALAELDASIDDWVTKLEQAENRRTRVRQKLLEHVAAAATLQCPGGVAVVSETLQLAMGVRPPNSVAHISTPPRSPTKPSFLPRAHSSSPSPQRVVAQVPSTILEQPLFEEPTGLGLDLTNKDDEAERPLRRAETIRIYADNDVYALLADVEDQITQMSVGDIFKDLPPLSDDDKKVLPQLPTEEPPSRFPLKRAATFDSATTKPEEQIFLTNAVFKPTKAVECS